MSDDKEDPTEEETAEGVRKLIASLREQNKEKSEQHFQLRLKYADIKRQMQEFSYELTQKLSFYVIGIEVVFCGYVLLNARTLARVDGARWLFLASGLAALSGIIWRMCYNEQTYIAAHFPEKDKEEQQKEEKRKGRYVKAGNVLYRLYLLFTAVFFVGTLIGGFQYLSETTAKSKPTVHSDSVCLRNPSSDISLVVAE